MMVNLHVDGYSIPARVEFLCPHPQEFEKFFPLPSRTRTLLTHTCSAQQTIPTRARPALFWSQIRTCPKTTKNS